MRNAFDKLPPHSVDAEMCVLASMMLDKQFAEQVLSILDSESFYLTDHKVIFEAIRGLTVESRPVDAIILRDELKRMGEIDRMGGAAYIAQILSTVPSAVHGMEYAQRVREKAALRNIISIADTATRAALAESSDSVLIASQLRDGASEVLSQGNGENLITFDEIIEEAYHQLDGHGSETVKTGFDDLDEITGGIGRGEMVVVAARPSMGKSTFARSLATNVAGGGVPVGFISLEESPLKIGRNILSAYSGVENHLLRKPDQLHEQNWADLGKAAVRAKKLPIILSRSARTIDEVRSTAFEMRAKHDIKLLIIDYLGRIRAPGKSIYEQVTAASGAISDLIKDLQIAGVVLCQLNRAVEQQEVIRPSMIHLRDSGAIEQDADGVLLLHREDYYRAAQEGYQPNGIVEVIIAKWRDGERGATVKLNAELSRQRIMNQEYPVAA